MDLPTIFVGSPMADIEKEKVEAEIGSWFDKGLIGGLDLLDVKIKGLSGRQRLVVTVDRAGGVTLDELTSVSRTLEDLLDRKETVSARYVLEVTSPGDGWPLTTAADFRRNGGRPVEVVFQRNGDDGESVKLTGVVGRVEERVVELLTDDGAAVEVDLDAVVSARKIFDFRKGRGAGGPKKGRGKKGTGSRPPVDRSGGADR